MRKKEPSNQTQISNNTLKIGLCLPHPLDALCDTNVVCFEFIQTDGGGKSESTQ